MLFVVPQVEKYTQGAIIEFYESKRGEDCYMLYAMDIYFYKNNDKSKSYAPYFYAERRAEKIIVRMRSFCDRERLTNLAIL